MKPMTKIKREETWERAPEDRVFFSDEQTHHRCVCRVNRNNEKQIDNILSLIKMNLWKIVSYSSGLRELQVSFVLQSLLCVSPLQVFWLPVSDRWSGCRSSQPKMSFWVKNRLPARQPSSLNFSNSVTVTFHLDASDVNLFFILISTPWALFLGAIFLDFSSHFRASFSFPPSQSYCIFYPPYLCPHVACSALLPSSHIQFLTCYFSPHYILYLLLFLLIFNHLKPPQSPAAICNLNRSPIIFPRQKILNSMPTNHHKTIIFERQSFLLLLLYGKGSDLNSNY